MPTPQAPTPTITIEDVAQYPQPGTAIPTGFAFSPDDALITYLHSAEGTLTQQLYAFDPATGDSRLLVNPAAGGETEDLGDIVRTLTVGATLTVRCRRDEIVDNSRIRPGDAIIGVSSTGKAAWEDEENSGISSNGLTLARHRLLHRSYLEKYPEIADPGLGGGLAYTGPYRLEDPLPGSESTVGEAVLSPTRTYAPFILALLGELGQAVHGLVHLTGGGQAKNLGFGKGIHYVKAEMFEVPPVFEAVRTASEPHIPWREMYRVFNMGHRLEVMVPPKYARAVMETAAGFGLDARVVGRCEENEGGGNRVTVRTPGGDESYTA